MVAIFYDVLMATSLKSNEKEWSEIKENQLLGADCDFQKKQNSAVNFAPHPTFSSASMHRDLYIDTSLPACASILCPVFRKGPQSNLLFHCFVFEAVDIGSNIIK